MELLWVAVSVVVASGLGVFVGAWVARQRAAAEIALLRQEHATLGERGLALQREVEQRAAREKELSDRVEALDAAREQAEIGRARAAERGERLMPLEAAVVEREREIASLRQQSVELERRCANVESTLRSEREATGEKLALLADAETKLREAFQALAAEALRANNEEFVKLAKGKLVETQIAAQGDLDARKKEVEKLVEPIQTSLKTLDEQVKALETSRVTAYAQLTTQIGQLVTTQQGLQRETGNLVKALRSPAARGRWGELQLKRVVEMAGMVEHCDFVQQESNDTEEGRLRPDMVVRLPGGATIVLDAKVPLDSYLNALEAQDDATRDLLLVDHARQVRSHFAKLGAKKYWEQQDRSPQFVVLFLPNEAVFSAALEKDPSLIEGGWEQKVVIATPTTLIALLRAVAYGWQNETVRQNAERIQQLGHDLYKRLVTFTEHFARLRKGLESAVGAYNSAAGSMERMVLPQARRFRELGATTLEDLPSSETIDSVPRMLDVQPIPPEGRDEPTVLLNPTVRSDGAPPSPRRPQID